MPTNYWQTRHRNGVRWRNRIANVIEVVLVGEKYDHLITAKVITENEYRRLFDVLYAFAVAAGREFDRLRRSGLTAVKLTSAVAHIIGKALLQRHWQQAIDDDYPDADSAKPERERTAKILGLVGKEVVRLILREAV